MGSTYVAESDCPASALADPVLSLPLCTFAASKVREPPPVEPALSLPVDPVPLVLEDALEPAAAVVLAAAATVVLAPAAVVDAPVKTSVDI